ncbi:hypothetical protein [Comamonas sp. JC664]|uniref:hypothetical protein n=1 Tax=Comamonas sp. JC664 TaxID=2801917 RepID=UPI00174AAA46|nr:hypothetical protein [Comamonas sp. JC664]MBL0697625.1 hypothetical protein [Comamonas sp. JC664]GHG68707.1 hypothetical protein GCM10012319_12160 [Comamonas sp. KCTC 72670]
MRWSPTLLLPLCLAATACGTSAKHQALIERRDAIRQMDAERELGARQDYRSMTGFQNTRWGMTKEEVLAVVPGAVQHNAWGDLGVTSVIADRPALVQYLFVEGQLAGVELHFPSPGAVRDHFHQVEELLTLKYGKPASRSDSAIDAANRLALAELANNLAVASDNYHAARSGYRPSTPAVDSFGRQREANARVDAATSSYDYALASTWQDTETGIVLNGKQEPGLNRLSLHYWSARLKPFLKKELTVRAQQWKAEQSQAL